jgi:hypothetical protein
VKVVEKVVEFTPQREIERKEIEERVVRLLEEVRAGKVSALILAFLDEEERLGQFYSGSLRLSLWAWAIAEMTRTLHRAMDGNPARETPPSAV